MISVLLTPGCNELLHIEWPQALIDQFRRGLQLCMQLASDTGINEHAVGVLFRLSFPAALNYCAQHEFCLIFNSQAKDLLYCSLEVDAKLFLCTQSLQVVPHLDESTRLSSAWRNAVVVSPLQQWVCLGLFFSTLRTEGAMSVKQCALF